MIIHPCEINGKSIKLLQSIFEKNNPYNKHEILFNFDYSFIKSISLTVFNPQEPITSAKFNENFEELNTDLSIKGFSYKYPLIQEGSPFILNSLNSIFLGINTMLKHESPLTQISANEGELISSSLINLKFQESKSKIQELYCSNNTEVINNQLFGIGNRLIYTIQSDYFLASSEISVLFSRGYPNVTGYGSISIIDPLDQVVWTESFNLGVSIQPIQGLKTYIINHLYLKKGNKLVIDYYSNNNNTLHASAKLNVNMIYLCP